MVLPVFAACIPSSLEIWSGGGLCGRWHVNDGLFWRNQFLFNCFIPVPSLFLFRGCFGSMVDPFSVISSANFWHLSSSSSLFSKMAILITFIWWCAQLLALLLHLLTATGCLIVCIPLAVIVTRNYIEDKWPFQNDNWKDSSSGEFLPNPAFLVETALLISAPLFNSEAP